MVTTVKLNIVIPSFNRDNLLAKCIGYLDKVFSRDNQNNGNILIDTQVTVYRQFDPAVGPETVDIKTDNINVRIINRHKYKNFVFGNMLYDMAHDTDGVSQIPSINQNILSYRNFRRFGLINPCMQIPLLVEQVSSGFQIS